MAKIVITKEVSNAIRAAATLTFRDTSKVLPDGKLEIEIDDEVYERLDSLRFANETFPDAILRALVAYRGQGNN